MARLIDADALKKCTCDWCNTHYSDEPCEPSDCIEMLRIDGQPTVDAVEVVHGEWTAIEDDWNMETIYQCSVCKEEFVTIDGTPAENLWNYCPNCGAKMDGERREGE